EMLDTAALANALANVLRQLGLQESICDRLAALTAQTQKPEALGHAIAAVVPPNLDALLVIDDYHHAADAPPSETLIATVAAETKLRLLLTSRTRPAWLSSRMSVYGEALCITADELAFSETEAREVLTVDSGPTDERILGHAR